MKKIFLSAGLLMMVTAFTACGGGGFRADVKKQAKYICDIQKLKAKPSSEANDKELEKLEKEKSDFQDRMRSKYKDKVTDDMRKEAEQIMMDAEKDCK